MERGDGEAVRAFGLDRTLRLSATMEPPKGAVLHRARPGLVLALVGETSRSDTPEFFRAESQRLLKASFVVHQNFSRIYGLGGFLQFLVHTHESAPAIKLLWELYNRK